MKKIRIIPFSYFFVCVCVIVGVPSFLLSSVCQYYSLNSIYIITETPSYNCTLFDLILFMLFNENSRRNGRKRTQKSNHNFFYRRWKKSWKRNIKVEWMLRQGKSEASALSDTPSPFLMHSLRCRIEPRDERETFHVFMPIGLSLLSLGLVACLFFIIYFFHLIIRKFFHLTFKFVILFSSLHWKRQLVS